MLWLRWTAATASAVALAYFASDGINHLTGCTYACYALLPSAILSGRAAATWALGRR